LGDARVVRRPGIDQASVIINHILVVITNPSVRRTTEFLASLEAAYGGRCRGGSAAYGVES